MLRPALLVPLALLVAVTPAPTAAAGCTVDLGECHADCAVNLGRCNYEGCAVNLSYCGASCVVASGPVGLRVLQNAGCQEDCGVNAGNVCGSWCPAGGLAGVAVVPYSGSPAYVIACVPPGEAAAYACVIVRCLQA